MQISGVVVFNLVKRPKKLFSRRNFLGLLGLGGVVSAGCVGYGRCLEPHWLALEQHEVALAKSAGKKPLKVLHLSDLHASEWVTMEFITSAIRLGLEQKPDLILLTGDFISERFAEAKPFTETLALLAKAAPTFACLGNHDGGIWAASHVGKGYADTEFVRGVLADAQVKLLHNTSESLEINGWNLTLVGVGDVWAQELRPEIAFASIGKNCADATLVLSHNPDTKAALKPFAWDMMFCGHTHGGQVCLPLVGPPFLPVRDRSFVAGLYRWDGRWLHITRGVGNIMGLRFNCRPEVSLLTLV